MKKGRQSSGAETGGLGAFGAASKPWGGLREVEERALTRETGQLLQLNLGPPWLKCLRHCSGFSPPSSFAVSEVARKLLSLCKSEGNDTAEFNVV